MNRLLLLCALVLSEVTAFQPFLVSSLTRPDIFLLHSKKSDGDEPSMHHAYAAGTFVEFEEKNRVHIGTIEDTEHKSNGGARYKVVDKDGKQVRQKDRRRGTMLD